MILINEKKFSVWLKLQSQSMGAFFSSLYMKNFIIR